MNTEGWTLEEKSHVVEQFCKAMIMEFGGYHHMRDDIEAVVLVTHDDIEPHIKTYDEFLEDCEEDCFEDDT